MQPVARCTFAERVSKDSRPPVDALLTIRVPPRRCEVSAQLLCRAARTVSWSVALDAPPFFQRASVHRVEAELIEQTGDRGLRTQVVTGNHQRATILRCRRLPIGGECGRVDMVEGLHDP